MLKFQVPAMSMKTSALMMEAVRAYYTAQHPRKQDMDNFSFCRRFQGSKRCKVDILNLLKIRITCKISQVNFKRDDVSSMNNICSDAVLDAETQTRAWKCIIHCFYGNHLIEMQILAFGSGKKIVSLFMLAVWEVLCMSGPALQTIAAFMKRTPSSSGCQKARQPFSVGDDR